MESRYVGRYAGKVRAILNTILNFSFSVVDTKCEHDTNCELRI